MLIIYFLISFGASIVGAISGIGGGVIIKPVLDTFSSFNVSVISFLSGNTVLAMTIVTLIRNRKTEVKLDKKISSLLAAGGIIGGLIGKQLFDFIRAFYSNENVIGSAQSIILAVLAFGVLLFTLYKTRIRSHSFRNSGFCLGVGFILGGIASFLGIGGGPINLAVLYFLFSMDSKTAALNSIYIIFFSQLTNLVFTIALGNVPPFPPVVLGLMILGGIGGGIMGARFSRKMENHHVDYLFSSVLAVIAGICIYNFIQYIN